jgi:hypothetical protein
MLERRFTPASKPPRDRLVASRFHLDCQGQEYGGDRAEGD